MSIWGRKYLKRLVTSCVSVEGIEMRRVAACLEVNPSGINDREIYRSFSGSAVAGQLLHIFYMRTAEGT
jgi:hypothetical protein